jgi:hypothetical protein
MPAEILNQIDINPDREIQKEEIAKFLDNKISGFPANEENLKSIAKELDDNMHDKKYEYYIDANILYKAHDDILQKIKENKDLTPSDINLLKLFLYLI